MRPFLRAAALLALLLPAPPARAADVDFTRDVRPILSRHCFKCHGFDDKARKAKLRLDVREVAVKKVIVPGKPDDSPLVRRIFATDDDEIMPPPTTKNPLTDAEKDVLKHWIAAGAEYKAHWAFVAPKQAPPLKVLLPDDNAEIEPIPVSGGGRKAESDQDRLSNILKSFNEQFGTLFTDADRIVRRITEDIAPKVAVDQPYRNARKNTPNAARIELDAALMRVIGPLLKDDTEFYKQFVQNESFRRFVTDMVVRLTSE